MTDEEDSADVCHPSSVTQRRGRRVASRCQGESMSAAVRRRGRACLSREDTFRNSVTSRAACAQAAARLHVPHLTSGLHPVLPASTHLFAAVSRPIDRREAAMRNKTVVGIALLVLAQGVAGCSATDSSSISLGPSAVPPQAAPPPPRPPGSWPAGTLTGVSIFGVVSESTPTSRVPIPGARVYCELCGTETHTFTTADASGFYIFPGDNPSATVKCQVCPVAHES